MEIGRFNQDSFLEISGKESGPTSVVLAGVHGNEPHGLRAFDLVIPKLEVQRGVVWFGKGNPRAILKNTRDTEGDLNRKFKPFGELKPDERDDWEYHRAQVIQKYLKRADALLDLHGTSNDKTKPHVICEPPSFEVAVRMPVDIVLTGMDQVMPGGTDYYMNQRGRIALCLEAGWNGDPDGAKIAEEGIYAFLKTIGHIEGEAVARRKRWFLAYGSYVNKTSEYSLIKPFKDFQKVKEGQVVATDGGQDVPVHEDSRIFFCSGVRIKEVGKEAFYLARDIPPPPEYSTKGT